MSKKQFSIICIFLLIIIVLLIYVVYQNNQNIVAFRNTMISLFERVDSLTTKVNMLK